MVSRVPGTTGISSLPLSTAVLEQQKEPSSEQLISHLLSIVRMKDTDRTLDIARYSFILGETTQMLQDEKDFLKTSNLLTAGRIHNLELFNRGPIVQEIARTARMLSLQMQQFNLSISYFEKDSPYCTPNLSTYARVAAQVDPPYPINQ